MRTRSQQAASTASTRMPKIPSGTTENGYGRVVDSMSTPSVTPTTVKSSGESPDRLGVLRSGRPEPESFMDHKNTAASDSIGGAREP